LPDKFTANHDGTDVSDSHFSIHLQKSISTIRELAHPDFNFTFSPALAPTPANVAASPLATNPIKLSDDEKSSVSTQQTSLTVSEKQSQRPQPPSTHFIKAESPALPVLMSQLNFTH
jgi:hypothetical protein